MPISTIETNEHYWPHAPVHRLSERGTYMVTASTYNNTHHFRTPERVSVLCRGLLKLTTAYGWKL